jgi:hypothetical protein
MCEVAAEMHCHPGRRIDEAHRPEAALEEQPPARSLRAAKIGEADPVRIARAVQRAVAVQARAFERLSAQKPRSPYGAVRPLRHPEFGIRALSTVTESGGIPKRALS